MQKIFVIEDDENIRNLVKVALEGYGFEVNVFETAEAALEVFDKGRPDLALFDIMLPGMNGLEAIKIIRAKEEFRKLPIIVLTAKDKEYDKVIGLDGGADDYITKPFGILELSARIRSHLRRSEQTADMQSKGALSLGTLRIDMATREVMVNEHKIMLTYKEYELLLYLVENRSRVVDREELLNELWDYNAEIETRTLDIHIRTLRQKLGEDSSRYIKTIRSVGYRFVVDED